MELSFIKSYTTFHTNESKKTDKYNSTPNSKTSNNNDVFVSGTKIAAKPVGSIFNKFLNKVKETINDTQTQQKINSVKLTKLLVENGTLSITDINKNKDFINELSKMDYDKVEKKYKTIIKNVQLETKDTKSLDYKNKVSVYEIELPLKYKKLEAQDIDEIYRIGRSRTNAKDSATRLSLQYFVRMIKNYDNFDNMPASTQKDIMIANGFNFPTYNSLSIEEGNNISEYSSLMKFDYIKDLKTVNSKEEFLQKMDTRRRNIPCKPIPTDSQYFQSKEDIENLSNALNQTDLTKYKTGFELKYSRDEFINDFNEAISSLPDEEKKKVFDNFQFKTNTSNDIINYPNPNPTGDVPKEAQELVNKFMLENKVKLAPEDKALENELNKIIKAYPEFVSVIGKIQHRGDSIDYHTMDDMKRIFNDPQFMELSDSEQKILTTATLFHDFGKCQGEVDEGHARKSAILAKEIIKKTDFSFDEKERIFNLINHSHWLVDGSTTEEIAFNFRRPNDFKMAEIFEKADSNSAGFEYEPTSTKIDEIHKNIDKINSTAIPLFAYNLPTEDKFYDKTESGIRYLDLRNPEMSVEKYGYSTGTKVKDLKFLCHSSSDSPENFEALCDDSKEVCLSTSLLDYRNRFTTGYNGMGSYILSGSNSNILLGGKDVACTGGQRGYNYAINTAYLRDTEGFLANAKKMRQIIPNQIKENLNLSDEEYLELYTQICNIENIEEVSDVSLQSGRTINSSDIKQTIKTIQQKLVEPKSEEKLGYTNEIVVYNPKIEAQAVPYTPEQLEKIGDKEKIYVLV